MQSPVPGARLLFGLTIPWLLSMATMRTAVAQGVGAISGRVTNAGGRPLNGVQVAVLSTGQSVATAANGRYSIPDVPSGAQSIRFLFPAYAARDTVVEIRPRQIAIADATMSSQP